MSRGFLTMVIVLLAAFSSFQWVIVQRYAEINDELRAALARRPPACVAPPIRARLLVKASSEARPALNSGTV